MKAFLMITLLTFFLPLKAFAYGGNENSIRYADRVEVAEHAHHHHSEKNVEEKGKKHSCENCHKEDNYYSDCQDCCKDGSDCCENGCDCCKDGSDCCKDGCDCCKDGSDCCKDGCDCCEDGSDCCEDASNRID